MFSSQVFSQEELSHREYREMLEEHPFGSITDRFTLTLTGYFDDCGEFGGHEETIELIRIERKLMAIVTIYSESCQSSNYKKPKVVRTKTYPIDENQIAEFQNYLSKLLVKSLELDYPFHAGRHYSAKLDFRKEYYDKDDNYSFERLNLKYHDTGSSWTEFQFLKSIVEK
jgi:hypothetical protein